MTVRKAAAKPARATKAKLAATAKPARRQVAAPAKPARRQVAAEKTRLNPKPAAKPKATRRKPAATAKRPRRARAAEQAGEAVAAVERDLKRMPTDVAKSAEAAAALAMASRLDSGNGSPSECAKALLAAMGKLREMCPPDTERGELHDIRSGRAARLASGRPAG